MSKSNLSLLLLAFILSACSMQGPDKMITFSQADPFTKILRESDYFPEYNNPEEVAGGEHACFQFVLKSGMPLNNLSAEISEFSNDDGNVLKTEPRIGFVGYVKEGRPTPERAKDAIISLSGYYPDPIIEKNDYSAPRDAAQPI